MKKITIKISETFMVPDEYEIVTIPTGETVLKIAGGKYLMPVIQYMVNKPSRDDIGTLIDIEVNDMLTGADKIAIAQCRAIGVSGDWVQYEDNISSGVDVVHEECELTFH